MRDFPTGREKLLSELWALQKRNSHISDQDVKELASEFNLSEVEIEGVISFYHFLHRQASGEYTIYLNNSIIAEFSGYSKVKEAFEQACDVRLGSTDKSLTFGLYPTSCIGMSDMEPAALINELPFTNLTIPKVHRIIQHLKTGGKLEDIYEKPVSKFRYVEGGEEGAIYLRPFEEGTAIRSMKSYTPEQIMAVLENGGVRGMGGAFFPVAKKWRACAAEESQEKYIVCNADEGEPGTFKDRILMDHLPGLMIEGMIVAAYAVGAQLGIIYLRAEYEYLLEKLKDTINRYSSKGWLGENIEGIDGFDFNIRIQLGAGAYVCGEETALLQSLEGQRGEPRARVHYPTEKGFRGEPTVVNNVETFCAVTRCLELGPEFYKSRGTEKSTGHKLLSVSGDCDAPGIYEIEWGMPLGRLLDLAGARNVQAVQISGPSGELVPSTETDRIFCISDLACGGSVMIYNRERDLMQILDNYNYFFMEESCGICTPCRGGNQILRKQLDRINQRIADRTDLENLLEWSKIMQYSSRCGLGKTAPRSIQQAIEKFPEYFREIVHNDRKDFSRDFNLNEAVREFEEIVKAVKNE